MKVFKWLFDGVKVIFDNTIGQYVMMGVSLVIAALLVWHFMVPDMSTIKEWFGADTKQELQGKLAQANTSVLDLVNKNNVCQRQLTTTETTCREQLALLGEHSTYTQQATDTLSKNNSARERKIKDIEKTAQKQANQATLTTTIATKISDVQIDALWDAYCSKNTDSDCEAEQGATK